MPLEFLAQAQLPAPWWDVSIGFLVHVTLLIITIPRILAIKRDATNAIAWIFAVLLLPFAGPVIFWMIGDPEFRGPFRRVVKGPPLHRAAVPVSHTTRRRAGYYRLQRLLARLGESPSTQGNRVEFFTDGRRAYREMLRALEGARHEICFQHYIVRSDSEGWKFARVLADKARTGVRVHFLYDAVGSKDMSHRFLRTLREAGIECHPFLPINLLRRRVQINFRNHRKLVVIDRQAAFTGGLNIGREYAGQSRWARRWFDAHMRIEGPAVVQLHEEFAADWAFAAGRDQTPLDARPAWLELTPPPIQTQARSRGWIQTVSSGPDQPINRMRSLMLFAVTRARDRLWLATPYFVPDEALLAALTAASLAGIDVRILTQNNRPDKWLPYFAARYF
ncbi:PLDc N-terminal domain-containing protein, partial [Candidatus Poribacteria bacterium]|nr:PLDc N-terminal domain-containing protein [Candidatus Poribacteria bacterium]